MTTRRIRFNRLSFATPDPGGGLAKNFSAIQSAIPSPQMIPLATATTLTVATADTALILADATSAAFAITLPDVALAVGLVVTLKKIDSSGHAVTVTAAGASLIDGSGTYSLPAQYNRVAVWSDGTHWWVVAT